MQDINDPGTIQLPLKRKVGRYQRVSEAEKRARRNERERLNRLKAKCGEEQPPVISPFAKGFDLLDNKPVPEASTSDSTELSVISQGFKHGLTSQQLRFAANIFKTFRERKISGLADNTRRTMRSDWRQWLAFCLEFDRQILPASPHDLMDFIGALVEAGYQRSTIEHALHTIKHMSELHQCDYPHKDYALKAYWRDMCRQRLSKNQKQAKGLTLEILNKMAESVDPSNVISCRSIALISVMYDALLRQSEVIALRWDDIQPLPEMTGEAMLLIRRSKTDQESKGHTAYLRKETMDWIEQWKIHAKPMNPYLFHDTLKQRADDAHLSLKAVSLALKHLCMISGIQAHMSGHSCRVGAAQDMTNAQLSLPEIMQIGRWKSPAMPAHYARNLEAVKSGRSRFSRITPTK